MIFLHATCNLITAKCGIFATTVSRAMFANDYGGRFRPQLSLQSANGSAQHFDVQFPNSLAQRVAIEAEKVGGLDLVAMRRRKRRDE